MGKTNFSWGDIKTPDSSNSSNNNSSDLYMKLEAGNKYRVRMYGVPVPRYFGWYNKKKYNVPEDLLEAFENHTSNKPKLTYVCNIIDREDTKNGKTRFKLLEKGPMIFSTMKTYFDETGVSPGGDVAPDFLIKSIPGKTPRNTKYEVMNLPGEKPFSDKEKELLDRKNKMDSDDLKRLPIGERGPIDIEAFYDMDRGRKAVQDLLDGKLAEDGEDVENLSNEVSSSDEEDTEEDSTVDSEDNDDEESLDDLIDKFS